MRSNAIIPPRPSDLPSPHSSHPPPPSSLSSSRPPATIVWNSREERQLVVCHGRPPPTPTLTLTPLPPSSSLTSSSLAWSSLSPHPPEHVSPFAPLPPSSSPQRHRRHFQHRHRPAAPPVLQAHIYPCTKNNSCIACHLKGCRSSDDTAADSGQGVSLDLFFWDSRRTCWTRIQSTASASEYHFALITAGMESLVTGFGSQARKKRAAFLAWASTLYSFLFVDIGSVEIKLGHANKEVPKKGKQLW